MTGDPERPFYRLLGPLRVTLPSGTTVEATHGSRQRMAVLGLLIIHAPQVVPINTLLRAVYAADDPDWRTRKGAIKQHISRLRRVLGDEIPHAGHGGYVLRNPDGRVDTHQFALHCRAAETAWRRGEASEAARLWSAGLDVWRGTTALQDLQHYAFAREFAATWAERRADAVLSLLDVLRELGNIAELGRILERETAAFPATVARWRQRQTSHGIVAGSLAATGEPLIGRQEIVERLRSAIVQSWAIGHPSPHIIRVSGPAGIGVTTVVDRLSAELTGLGAHVCRVDMRGTRRQARATENARVSLLTALGVSPDDLPEGPAARAELYDKLIAGVPAADRLVVILDHVSHRDQVAALMPPPGAPVTVIVCSRPDLTGIPAAAVIELPPLTIDDAVEMLRRIVGGQAITRYPRAARTLVSLCDRIPQFIQIIGTKVLDSGQTLAECVETIGGRRLQDSDLDAADVLDYSIRDLPALQRDAFALIGRLEAETVTASRAAALLDTTTDIATAVMTGLVAFRLLAIEADGRYRIPRVLAGYARALPLGRSWPEAFRLSVDHLLAETRRVAAQVQSSAQGPGPPARITALDWYETESANLAGAVEQAADEGALDVCWRIVDAVTPILSMTVATADWDYLVKLALGATVRLGDQAARARVLMSRAELLRYRGEYEESFKDYDTAVEVFSAEAEAYGLARALDGRADIGAGLAVTTDDNARMVEAEADARRSYELFAATGDQRGAASALASLGEVLALSGRNEEAVEVIGRSLELYRSVPDPVHEAIGLRILGSIHQRLGRPDTAHRLLTTALGINRRIGTHLEEARTLVKLGEVDASRGRPEQARIWYEAALVILEPRHDLRWRAAARMHYGELLLRAGDQKMAVQHIRGARDIFQKIGDKVMGRRCDDLLGTAHHD